MHYDDEKEQTSPH